MPPRHAYPIGRVKDARPLLCQRLVLRPSSFAAEPLVIRSFVAPRRPGPLHPTARAWMTSADEASLYRHLGGPSSHKAGVASDADTQKRYVRATYAAFMTCRKAPSTMKTSGDGTRR